VLENHKLGFKIIRILDTPWPPRYGKEFITLNIKHIKKANTLRALWQKTFYFGIGQLFKGALVHPDEWFYEGDVISHASMMTALLVQK
jgi:hypothetical protein